MTNPMAPTKTERAQRIALNARAFVRKARRDGHTNLITGMLLAESAQALKLLDTDGWTIRKAARLTVAELEQAQELVRAEVPDLTVYDADGRYVLDGPGQAPVFHLGGWRFGGGSAYSALVEVADLLILNPRTGPGA